MNMGSNGRGNRDLVRRKENENGYYLAVFHALGAPADHQTEVVGSVTQTHDRSDRAGTKITCRSSRAPPGNDEPARISYIPLHRYQRQRRSSARHSSRSEEHTSELQSQSNLVCRLL